MPEFFFINSISTLDIQIFISPEVFTVFVQGMFLGDHTIPYPARPSVATPWMSDMETFPQKKNKPIGSMYGIFAYIYHKNQPNEGR